MQIKIKKILSIISISCLSALAYPLASFASTAAIQLKFDNSVNTNDAIFIYKRVKNPLASTACNSQSSNNSAQCYIWKQVGYLPPPTIAPSAYVFIDPPDTKDAYGQPVQYKVAQGTVDSNSGEVTQWTGLCALDPNTLSSGHAISCGDSNITPSYIQGYQAEGGPNYATAEIILSSQGSIGFDYNLSLPVFYTNPVVQKEVPLSYWAQGYLYNPTDPPGPIHNYAISIQTQTPGSCALKKIPFGDNVFYTSPFSLAENSVIHWKFNLYAVLGSQLQYLYPTCTDSVIKIASFKKISKQPATQISLDSSPIQLGSILPGSPSFYLKAYPTRSVYCINAKSNLVKKFDHIQKNANDLFEISSSYYCPASTGYIVQIAQKQSDFFTQTMSDLHLVRINNINYKTWNGPSFSSKALIQRVNTPLSTIQKTPLTIGLDDSPTGTPDGSNKAKMLMQTVYAGPIAIFTQNQGAPNLQVAPTSSSMSITIPNMLTIPMTKVTVSIKKPSDTDNNWISSTKPASDKTPFVFDNLLSDTQYEIQLTLVSGKTSIILGPYNFGYKTKPEAFNIKTSPAIKTLTAPFIIGTKTGTATFESASFSSTPDSVEYTVIAINNEVKSYQVKCSVSKTVQNSQLTCNLDKRITAKEPYTVIIKTVAKKGSDTISKTTSPVTLTVQEPQR